MNQKAEQNTEAQPDDGWPTTWPPVTVVLPNDIDLAAASPTEQIKAMRRWFLASFRDPAEDTPYDAQSDGYIWAWGGPYDPMEQLLQRFGSLVDNKVISELAAELYVKGGAKWAPVGEPVEDCHELFAFDVKRPDEPLFKLRLRLREALSVLNLQGEAGAVGQLSRMAFGAAISALEAYLWETIAFWVKDDHEVLKRLVSTLPDLKDQPIKLGQIFEQYDAIEARVMAYLQNLVWHRWDKVAQLFRSGLDVRVPSFKPFEAALVKRHDIVHRSGHDKDGNPVSASPQDARELAQAVENFANQVFKLIMEKRSPFELPF